MAAVPCAVCDAEVDAAKAAKIGRAFLCDQHADLALHAARKMSNAVASAGLSHDRQALIGEAWRGLGDVTRAFRRLLAEAGAASPEAKR